ncbi:flagellar biosynthetic protein FliO [Enterococcus cecorum]|uniref:flagellar biosynthetic protein FliO n=1 Tax=Enterococcus cecorum TaxID=44008 RepID=UPI0022CF95EA|nr:flagellar biosynthetic protein FliO [Enterococcus cecorum]
MDLIFPIIKMVVFLIVILYLVVQALKFLNKQMNPENSILQVIQRISVSKSSSIAIVKMFDRYYVMSISENQNQIIKELTLDEIQSLKAFQKEQVLKQSQLPKEFRKLLNKEINSLQKRKDATNNEKK